MKPILALRIVFIIALAGVAFSGTLMYQELFGSEAVSCPAPGTSGTILGYPACVYGFGMYVVLVIVAGLGIFGARRSGVR